MAMWQKQFLIESNPEETIHSRTQKELSTSTAKVKKLTKKLKEVNKDLKNTTTQLKRKTKDDERKSAILKKQKLSFEACKNMKKTLDKKTQKLQKKKQKLNEMEAYCIPHNIKRREVGRDKKIQKYEKTIAEQQERIQQLEKKIGETTTKVKDTSVELRKRRESRNYFQDVSAMLREDEKIKEVQNNKILLKQNEALKAKNKQLTQLLDMKCTQLEESLDWITNHI